MKINEKLISIWLLLACIAITIIMIVYNTTIPFFTYIFLITTLVAILRSKNAECVGFTKANLNKLAKITLLYFIISAIIIIGIELSTQTYRYLLGSAITAKTPDPTFLWLTEYKGVGGLAPMFMVSTLITIFAEEIFFRGYLLQKFLKKYSQKTAIILQAVLFSLPHIIAATIMPLSQGIMLVVGYGIIIYGILGGIAATKTNSFWPGLIVANINNLLLTAFYLM